jgi:small subunit ribosomal protein S2
MDLKETKTKELLTLQQLFNTGIHLGHRTSYWNAKMAPYIFGIRNDLHIINIEKSLYLIRRGMQLILQVLEQKGTILIVGNSESNQHFIHTLGEKYEIPYVSGKWVGGILSNWENNSSKGKIQDKILHFTKGLRFMNKTPSLVILLNSHNNWDAISEINKLNIPILGIVDTDSNLTNIAYPIPGNDDSVPVQYFYSSMIEHTILASIKNKMKS